MGLLASASLNKDKLGLYEPAGGSAPDIAGQGIANPIAQILSAAMMLRFGFHDDTAAAAVENAVSAVLNDGVRTADISVGSKIPVSTSEMGDAVVEYIRTGL